MYEQSIREGPARRGVPTSRGTLRGQKPPLKLKEIWAIRIRLQLHDRTRDLAMFNLARRRPSTRSGRRPAACCRS
jgi:hypothetical protein